MLCMTTPWSALWLGGHAGWRRSIAQNATGVEFGKSKHDTFWGMSRATTTSADCIGLGQRCGQKVFHQKVGHVTRTPPSPVPFCWHQEQDAQEARRPGAGVSFCKRYFMGKTTGRIPFRLGTNIDKPETPIRASGATTAPRRTLVVSPLASASPKRRKRVQVHPITSYTAGSRLKPAWALSTRLLSPVPVFLRDPGSRSHLGCEV
jgi:hypothetical protein